MNLRSGSQVWTQSGNCRALNRRPVLFGAFWKLPLTKQPR